MKLLDHFIISVFIVVFALISCHPTVNSDVNAGFDLDSLIQLKRLNQKAIMLSFGGEAVTAINTKKGIVVIDAGMGTGITSKYRKMIEKEFQSDEFKILILTHGHHDHFGGSRVFTDATVVAHENCTKAIIERWRDPERVKSSLTRIINEYNVAIDSLQMGSREWIENVEIRARFQSEYDDFMSNITAKPPDITFSDTLSLDMADVTLDMIWFGKAHSESDILIHVPELKLLFTGDLFWQYGRPSVDNPDKIDTVRIACIKSWTKNRFQAIDIIVGGHGQMLSKDDLNEFFRKLENKGY